MFPKTMISVWAIFSHPQHYHSYSGISDAFRSRISEEILICQKRLKEDLGEKPNIKIKFCFIDDVLALRPYHSIKPDVILFLMESRNFEEGIYDPPIHEFELKAYLKALKIPYTGCDGLSLFSDYDKSLQYSLAISCGIAVPKQIFVSDLTDFNAVNWFDFPAFVKPCLHGDSIGIRKSSIVFDKMQLKAEINRQRQLFPHEPLVIQEFLSGHEYTIGIMGNWNSTQCHTLPIIQIGFDHAKESLSILTHGAKNDPNSSEYMQDFYHIAKLPDSIEEQIVQSTLAIYRRLKCLGYARADWRLDKNGQPRFLEINALPDIMDDASSIIKMYRHKSGNGQSDFLLEIINYALDAH